MTQFALILAFILPLLHAPQANETMAASQADSFSKNKKEILVYYFHTSRRCKTCLSIERVSKTVVEEQYAKDKTVTFRSVNIEESENEALAEKYEIGGSALLIVCGDNSRDLTGKAFQYGLSDPGKLQALIIETINILRKA